MYCQCTEFPLNMIGCKFESQPIQTFFFIYNLKLYPFVSVTVYVFQ